MTFNVQMLPLPALALSGQSDRADAIAENVADAILGLPPAEQPDVIAFNEAFNNDGRDTLLHRLKPGWPSVVEKPWDSVLQYNSGLMLFSRFPYLPLPTGGDRLERFYGDSADSDSLASKGVGIVQIDTPQNPTTIAFTHLQASYETEDQYTEIRAKQLDTIYDALELIFATNDGNRGSVIIMGDLNIRGDSASVSGEWARLFELGGTRLFRANLDGWKTYMHPPSISGVDEGLTNIEFEDASHRQRLDYMCFAKSGIADIQLVPQHMRIRLRKSSDHFALEGVVQRKSQHCTPSDAIEALAVTPLAGGGPGQPTSIRLIDVNVRYEGSYQWLFVKQPGTYTIHKTPGLDIECYLVSDLTHPVARLDTLDLRLLPDELRGAFRERHIDPHGDTFACRESFFVLAKPVGNTIGAGQIWLTEHMGESDVTAIFLLLHKSVKSSFPSAQRLGADDICWFRATMPKTFAGRPWTEQFLVHNPSGGTVTADILDIAELPLVSSVSSSGETLTANADFSGGEPIFLTLQRANDTLVGFDVTWKSPLSYLDLDDPLYLYVADESGIDRLGADEPEMQINFDSAPTPVFAGSWDDADTGERWPGLAEKIRMRVATVIPGVTKVGFTEGIFLGYVDPDFNAQGWQAQWILPLAESEPDRVVRTVTLPVPDAVSDGLYTFTCTITRFP